MTVREVKSPLFWVVNMILLSDTTKNEVLSNFPQKRDLEAKFPFQNFEMKLLIVKKQTFFCNRLNMIFLSDSARNEIASLLGREYDIAQ